MEPTLETTPAPQRRSANRSWIKWVALGCSGIVVLGLLVAAGIVALAMGLVKQSDAYRQAMQVVQASPEAVDRLGEPIRAGWFISGSVNVTGPSGEASLAVPVRGPEGRGTLYVEADRSAGRWSFTLLELEIRETGERIDLLPAPGD